jgi:hypothetical protein
MGFQRMLARNTTWWRQCSKASSLMFTGALYPETLLSDPDNNFPSDHWLSDVEYFSEIQRYGSVPPRLWIDYRCP